MCICVLGVDDHKARLVPLCAPNMRQPALSSPLSSTVRLLSSGKGMERRTHRTTCPFSSTCAPPLAIRAPCRRRARQHIHCNITPRGEEKKKNVLANKRVNEGRKNGSPRNVHQVGQCVLWHVSCWQVTGLGGGEVMGMVRVGLQQQGRRPICLVP